MGLVLCFGSGSMFKVWSCLVLGLGLVLALGLVLGVGLVLG